MRRWAQRQTALSNERPPNPDWFDFGLRTGLDPTYTGHLGEAIVWCEWPQCRFFHRGRFDLLTVHGKAINVRTRTKCKEPRADDCHVMPDFMVSDDPHLIYVLVCLLHNLQCGWLCGWIPASDFVRLAVFQKKGTKAHNGMVHRVDAWTIEMRCIHNIETFNP